MSPEGVVESGNGRTLALQQVYREGGERAANYRQYLEEEGFDTAGMAAPVLVRVRENMMEPAEVEAFTREANARDTLGYSATEQAMSDSASMPSELLDMYRGGDIDAAGNRDFVRGFLQRVVPANDYAGMVAKDGSISQGAIQRVRAALLARAYGNASLVDKVAEAADSNIKALGGALTDVAGAWARLVEGVKNGSVDPDMDITANINEAAQIVDQARREGTTVAEIVGQLDIFSGRTIDEKTEQVLRLMFATPRFTRPTSRKAVAEALGYYVEQAMMAAPAGGGLLADAPKATPGAILARAKGKQGDEATEQTGVFDRPATGDGRGVRPSSRIGDESAGEAVQADNGEPTSQDAVGQEPASAGPDSFELTPTEPPAPKAAPVKDDSEPDMFGGPTSKDVRASLERKGEGRMRSGKAQKAPGEDGGLFDVRDTTADAFADSFTVSDARYAKGKLLVRTIPDGSGIKTRADRLAAALGGRWVGRESGYIMGAAAVEKLKTLHAAGFSADTLRFTGEPATFYHHARGLRDLTVNDALKAAKGEDAPKARAGSTPIVRTAAEAKRFATALKARLKDIGISDRIALVLANAAELAHESTQGQYWNRVITVALDVARDPERVVTHEAVHAMKALGLFARTEWKLLTDTAWRDADIKAWAVGNYQRLSEADQREEAAAEWVARRYAASRDMKAGSLGDRIAYRIAQFLNAVAAAYRKATGRQDGRDVARAIDSGAIGRRETGYGEAPRDRPDATSFGRKGLLPEENGRRVQRELARASKRDELPTVSVRLADWGKLPREGRGRLLVLRARAKRWYDGLIESGASVERDGWTIGFYDKGRDKTLRGGERLLLASRAIPAAIARGEYLGASPGDRPGIKALHSYAANVRVGGDEIQIIVTVRETVQGSFHYSLHDYQELGPDDLAQTSGKATRANTPALEGEAGPDSNISDAGAGGKPRASHTGPITAATPEFRRWFGDSKVVDENGRPLVVYHGTDQEFDAFDTAAEPKAYETDRGKIFLTSNYQQAEYYASEMAGGDLRQSESRGDPRIIRAYVSMQNPFVIDNSDNPVADWDRWGDLYTREMEEGGHDGILIQTEDGSEKLVIATKPTQIKSVENRGAFDPGDPDIRASHAPTILDSMPERLWAPIRAIVDALGGGNSRAIGKALDNFRTVAQDRMLPVLRAQAAVERMLGRKLNDAENPYIGEELFHGRTGARLDALTDTHVTPLFEQMHEEKVTPDELETFLYARHARERNARIARINPEFAPGEGSGMTDAEADAIMAAVDKSGKRPALDRLAARVDAMLGFALETRVEAGLLSRQEAANWKATYRHYVPLRGKPTSEAETEGLDRINRQSGMSVRGKESRRAFGRKSKAQDILPFAILQAEEAIVRAEQNEVAKQLYALASAAPDKGFWTIDKIDRVPAYNEATGQVRYESRSRIAAEDAPFTVSVKIDGDEHRVTFNRDNAAAVKVATAMRNLNVQQFQLIVGTFGAVNRFLSAINTSYNPEFVVTNAMRDLQTAAVNLTGTDVKGLAGKVLADYPAALAAATKGAFDKGSGEWAKWYNEFRMEGGQTAFNDTRNIADLRKEVAKAAKRAGRSRLDARTWARTFVHGIEGVNSGVENALRLATYKNAIQAGLSKKHAASLAKNVTVNFNRKGSAGPLINSLYLFYNASMQGTTIILQKMRSKKVQAVLAGAIVAGFWLEVLNSMWSDDDDDGEKFYDKIPEFEKERNLILMIDRGRYVKFPLPWGYNVFPNMGRMFARMYHGDGKLDAFGDWAWSALDAFNPVGGADNLANLLSPTVLDPIVDLELNRDFADRPIMRDKNQFGPQEPDAQRYWGSVPPYWKAVTDFLAEATGGDDVRPGRIDISPETLDYLQQTAFGAAGNFVRNLMSLGSKAASDDPMVEIETREIPFARKVVGNKPGWYDKAAFYARLADVEQTIDYGKKYLEAGDTEALDRLFVDEGDVIAMEDIAKQARKEMRQHRKATRELDYAVARGEIATGEAKSIRANIANAERATITAFNGLYLERIEQPVRP